MPNIHPQARRSSEEQAHLEAVLRDMFEHRLPFNELIGLKVASLAPDAPKLSFAMRPELIGSYVHGRLHGGMISAALDTVGGLAVTVGIAEKHAGETAEQVAHRFGRIGTIDLRVDYLRPGLGERFLATGRITRLGGRIASVQMTLENEAGVLVATGAGSYVIS
ncbi:MAG: Phenylacetic acid degradation-related protein [Rhodocyclaceae bacterium]|nr:Phenylacetic acid degradation-related protein [Rhodocyclaceae bacterium]